MLRNSLYLLTGSLWTLTSTYAFLSFLRPIHFYFETGMVLVSAMSFGLILFVAAGAMGSQLLRLSGSVYHVLYPLAWAQSVAASFGIVLHIEDLLVLGLSALLGSGLCDYGVYRDLSWGPGAEDWELGSLESELFRVAPSRPLAACDSGAFSTLPAQVTKGPRSS